MRGVSVAILALLLIGGCPALGPSTSSLNGDWFLTMPGIGNACLHVSEGKITEWISGCDGMSIPISNSQEAAISGDRIIWIYDITTLNMLIRATIDVEMQPDGSLSGTYTLYDGSGTGSLGMVMTR